MEVDETDEEVDETNEGKDRKYYLPNEGPNVMRLVRRSPEETWKNIIYFAPEIDKWTLFP